jgi:hypothetical protein
VILLSLVLVVVSAATLGFGVFDSSDELVWVSLVTGLGAVALIAGSVVRRRRQLVPDAVPDAVGPTTDGVVAVGSASAGVDPAPSPTPSRPAEPASGPVSTPGPWTGPPSGSSSPTGAQTWPWATTPPGGSSDTGSRPGWTGPVPDVTPPGDTGPADVAGGGTPPGDTGPPEFAGGGTPPGDTRPPEFAGGGTSSGDTGPPEFAGGGTPSAAAASPAEVAGSGTPPAAGTAPGAAADAPTAWDAGAPSGFGADGHAAEEAPGEDGEPGVERLAVRDSLRVAQLNDEVVVVDGHPRYHLAECPTLAGAETMPLAVSVARRGGFTPCAVCAPDATLLARSRARSAERTNDGR